MRVSVINARELTAEHIGAWSAIQSANAELESPFFCPEFTLAVSRATDNIFVGILHGSAGQAAGFFPFQLVRPGFGKNLEMCDYQGVIAPAALELDAKELVKGCGLKVWEFDHLIPAIGHSAVFIATYGRIADHRRAQGYEAYKAALSPEGKRHLAKAMTSAESRAGNRLPQTRPQQRGFRGDADDASVARAKIRPAPRSGTFRPRNDADDQHARFCRGAVRAVCGGEIAGGAFRNPLGHSVALVVPAYNPELPNYAPGIQSCSRWRSAARTLA